MRYIYLSKIFDSQVNKMAPRMAALLQSCSKVSIFKIIVMKPATLRKSERPHLLVVACNFRSNYMLQISFLIHVPPVLVKFQFLRIISRGQMKLVSLADGGVV